MKFQTKKELLRYLWKNEDDRKLVDRMVARGEVRLEWRIYVLEEKEKEVSSSSSDLANDLEYLNKEYEKLEGLLDYSLRKCYDIMKKKGLVGSEDTYDDFYNNITGWYGKSIINVASGSVESGSVAERGEEKNAWLCDLMKKYNIGKASDFIS
jgi:hypothetical protein